MFVRVGAVLEPFQTFKEHKKCQSNLKVYTNVVFFQHRSPVVTAYSVYNSMLASAQCQQSSRAITKWEFSVSKLEPGQLVVMVISGYTCTDHHVDRCLGYHCVHSCNRQFTIDQLFCQPASQTAYTAGIHSLRADGIYTRILTPDTATATQATILCAAVSFN